MIRQSLYGGTDFVDYIGYTFDLSTGEPVDISAITGMDEEEIKDTVAQAVVKDPDYGSTQIPDHSLINISPSGFSIRDNGEICYICEQGALYFAGAGCVGVPVYELKEDGEGEGKAYYLERDFELPFLQSDR